ncbi:MAG TPA: serine/threonine-protein kinase [Polyangium sp.]|nr:serine/threonine-protein kinase [Polyangium sp.]
MARKVDGQLGDKYQLSAILGQGANGTVYAAKNLRTQKRIAIKSLHLRAGLEPGSPEILRFEQEARIAGSLDSPHVAQVLDIEHDPTTGLPFLVMELLRGEDLQSLLDRVGPLPVDVALRITAQACAGLAAAHIAGVIHRDIKPANIFLAKQEKGRIVVKILDFGIAKIRRLPDASGSSEALAAPAVSMTETGEMLGSPLFMSPEQVDGSKHVDGRSDLFSLGVTLFTMLAGKAPHADVKAFPMLLARLLNAPPPPIRTIAAWVPVDVEAFLQKASALNRDDRFANAQEMLTHLEKLIPNGSELREDMLIGRGDAAGPVVEQMGSDPYARTEQAMVTVAVEPSATGHATTMKNAGSTVSVTVDPNATGHGATLQSGASTTAGTAEPQARDHAATLQSAGALVKVAVEPNPAPNRMRFVMAIILVVLAILGALFWFAR